MSYARTRRVQRIHLAQPVVARLGTAPVLIVDISVLGARLEHHTPLPTGSSARLAFVWDDVDITVESKTVRARLERVSGGADGVTVYNAGLEFHNLDGCT